MAFHCIAKITFVANNNAKKNAGCEKERKKATQITVIFPCTFCRYYVCLEKKKI